MGKRALGFVRLNGLNLVAYPPANTIAETIRNIGYKDKKITY
ncbi:hypothetical protein YN1HA_22830 [Sulfurisphaera ohwakuensis]